MKIKEIHLNKFKRFTDLKISGIPETAKLIILVGPNGCGKTSLFEGFNHWYKYNGYSTAGNEEYYVKKEENEERGTNRRWVDSVTISVHDEELNLNNKNELHGRFYFRTAFRNDPDFTTSSLSKQSAPQNQIKYPTLMLTDSAVSENYQRLVSKTLSNVYSPEYDNKNVIELRNELIGKINTSLKNIFEDLELTSIGEPLEKGSFYFTKGNSKNFHYKNLSAGEKAVFDLILDLIIKSVYYNNTIFCIDEPEIHMHTALQAKLLEELYNLIPDNSQLWIATHSIGMLSMAREIEEKHENTVCFIDFSDLDFDTPIELKPTQINRPLWKKFMELAFGEFAKLLVPPKIVFCEGDPNGKERKSFDASIYNRIFSSKYIDVLFVAVGGGCEQVEDLNNVSIKIVKEILSSHGTFRLVDRDDKSDNEVNLLNKKGIKVLGRRHLECYLLDDEIIRKLCIKEGKEDKIDECLQAKKVSIEASVARGKPNDDIKSAKGDIYNALKRILSLTKCGNNSDAFLRDTMAPLITEDTNVYKELEHDIFS